ncbi:MAG: SDR family oxidoreductase [Dehalococcoidia bacterium]|nr:SDR family oxidoreductase [Dehalococcoidia bacterium]
MAEWQRSEGFDLTGKRALVVGFGNPAGRAIAMALAEAGADVAAASATMDGDEVMEAKRVSRKVTEMGRTSMSQGWDVTLPQNVQVGTRQLAKEFGKPSILVFNADVWLAQPIEQVKDSDFGRVLQTNLGGAFYTSRSFLRELEEGTPGRIIFITSLLGERGHPGMTAYASARSGLIGLASSLSQEVAERGVTVNTISTGWMDWTPGRGPDEIGENLLMRFIPMRRFGKADELGPMAVLLASDAAGYLNGQVFHVDGGVGQHL